MVTKEEIERLGFKVHAVTKFADGLAFDALPLRGHKRLIHGDKMPTYHMALAALYMRCAGR
jgi:hypothetical protein